MGNEPGKGLESASFKDFPMQKYLNQGVKQQ